MNTDLLTAAQVAERKGVKPRTVARWAESGLLPIALRLPGATGALLFSPAAVDAFVPPAIAAPAESGAA